MENKKTLKKFIEHVKAQKKKKMEFSKVENSMIVTRINGWQQHNSNVHKEEEEERWKTEIILKVETVKKIKLEKCLYHK